MDRQTRLAALGLQRNRVLDCLGGNSRLAPGYFDPADDADLIEAFADYVAHMSQLFTADADHLAVSLLAAGRLLTGDLAGADVIIADLPAEAFKLDHGAGVCVVTPLHVCSAVLPLPASLKDTRLWLAGSPQQAALRTWLTEHRKKLRWDSAASVYLLHKET